MNKTFNWLFCLLLFCSFVFFKSLYAVNIITIKKALKLFTIKESLIELELV